jgi:hypothetical protein
MKCWSCKPRSRQWWALSAGFIASALLLGVESGFSQDTRAKSDARAEEVRRLVREAKKFFALPPEQQEAMRKLDNDLNQLPRGERERLLQAMRWYADWLDKLSPQERDAIVTTPDRAARLTKIRDHLEQQWIARQPHKTRDLLAKLPPGKTALAVTARDLVGRLAAPGSPGPLLLATTLFVDSTDVRLETIKRLKHRESQQNREWLIASRFWQDLTDPDPKKRPAMPARAGDFGPDVDVFVKDYLRPALSEQEKERLDKAEGHWPQYPLTLVELADRHPMALPQKHGPVAYHDLPKGITDKVAAKWEAKDAKGNPKAAPATFFLNQANSKKNKERLEKIEPGLPTRLACVVATYLHTRKVERPYELWAAKSSDLGRPMKEFLDPDGSFMTNLTDAERAELRQAEGKWPEYPFKIKQLAEKYGFKPPWQSLPDPSDAKHQWDKYRTRPGHRAQAGFRPWPAPLADRSATGPVPVRRDDTACRVPPERGPLLRSSA